MINFAFFLNRNTILFCRENGDWQKLPPNEREQQAAFFQHIGLMARFDNILGRETIQSLRMLTTEIKSIFCHPTMVDRLASMLNYILIQLVGPNKKNLKVVQYVISYLYILNS